MIANKQLFKTYLQIPIGWLEISGSIEGVSKVAFVATGSESDKQLPQPVLEAKKQLRAYFANNLTEFDLEVDLVGTESKDIHMMIGSRSNFWESKITTKPSPKQGETIDFIFKIPEEVDSRIFVYLYIDDVKTQLNGVIDASEQLKHEILKQEITVFTDAWQAHQKMIEVSQKLEDLGIEYRPSAQSTPSFSQNPAAYMLEILGNISTDYQTTGNSHFSKSLQSIELVGWSFDVSQVARNQVNSKATLTLELLPAIEAPNGWYVGISNTTRQLSPYNDSKMVSLSKGKPTKVEFELPILEAFTDKLTVRVVHGASQQLVEDLSVPYYFASAKRKGQRLSVILTRLVPGTEYIELELYDPQKETGERLPVVSHCIHFDAKHLQVDIPEKLQAQKQSN